MQWRNVLIVIISVSVLNLLVRLFHFRWDVTEDRRYSLTEQTCTFLSGIDTTIGIKCYLDKDVNASFRRLHRSVSEMVSEMQRYAKISFTLFDKESETLPEQLSPIVVHEKGRDGKLSQIAIYPYLKINCREQSIYVSLLQNNRSVTGAENINRSIECLEYTIIDALSRVVRNELDKIVFIEGHSELTAREVYDWTETLGHYYLVERKHLDPDSTLRPYKVAIIAGGVKEFSETEKYIIDQYIMSGGRVLWLLDGVRISDEELMNVGSSPMIANEINLEEMLFRYGVRVLPGIVEDVQCLTIPVDVSQVKGQTNFQPIPYYAYPLLLTSSLSPITRGLNQVYAKFISPVEFVGEGDSLRKQVLLATSTHSRLKLAPSLYQSSYNEDISVFKYAYIPVAVSLDGVFKSYFAHRIPPIGTLGSKKSRSSQTRQIVVGGSRLAKNIFIQGRALPVGYDIYSNVQFGNRDFLLNCVQFLCDDIGLLNLRNKTIKLRLLNESTVYQSIGKIKLMTLVVPVGLLILCLGLLYLIRRKKYCF